MEKLQTMTGCPTQEGGRQTDKRDKDGQTGQENTFYKRLVHLARYVHCAVFGITLWTEAVRCFRCFGAEAPRILRGSASEPFSNPTTKQVYSQVTGYKVLAT